MILSFVKVSVLLGSLLYNELVLAGKSPADVNVANLPLDEKGNLKVSSAAASEVVTVVEDLNLSWTGGFDSRSDLNISL